ncbi:heme NO-binding domain-containing protein [Nocardioides sp.]|uniref:heme NO-binding domain-containing protein n=1 Tax=Nocardioides sp. TaxID=35761 RepID=UPI0035637DD7
MKGIIFNVVEEAVTVEHGESMWDALLTRTGLDGSYTSLGDYPDADLHALIRTGAEMLDVTEADLTRRLGHASLISLAGRYPGFFTPHRRTRDFVLRLNDVIHPEVRKLHRNADPPVFDFEVLGENVLIVGYRSSRGLCALAEGMISGAATYFGESCHIHHDRCTRDGSPSCRLVCTFSDEASDGRA